MYKVDNIDDNVMIFSALIQFVEVMVNLNLVLVLGASSEDRMFCAN